MGPDLKIAGKATDSTKPDNMDVVMNIAQLFSRLDRKQISWQVLSSTHISRLELKL